MEKQDISKKVADFISEQFIFDEDLKIGNDDSLLESGTIDSTGILELVLYLEENFSIKVEDEELVPDNLDSINKIAEFVAAKTAA
ncbi:MAG: acyl carrier protein [Candidatus Zixiibacteriota bacterium]